MAEADCCVERRKSFNWKIQYPHFFSDCHTSSPSFSMDSCGFTRYYLDFVSEKKSGFVYDVSLYLNRHDWHSELGDIVLDIVTIFTYDKENVTSLFKNVKFFGREKIFQKSISLNSSEIINERDILFKNVSEDSIKNNIIFQVDIAQNIDCEEIEDSWDCDSEDLESLSSDIAAILYKEQFADLIFKSSDDKPVKLHRVILTSRYATLASSLNILETPKEESSVEADYDEITFLLRYLYSGKIHITDSLFGLYKLLKKAPLFHLQSILYSEPDYIFATTSVPLKHGYFALNIPNFNELQNESAVVNYFACDNFLLWTHLKILLYIGENPDGERSVAFKIQRMEQDRKLFMLCRISVIGYESYTEFFQLNFESEREKVIPSFIKMREIHERENSFLKKGSLELGFDVVLSNLVETSKIASVEYLFPEIGRPFMNLWAFRKDIASLYMNPSFSDIVIQHEDLKIPAHKVILCARSPVLSQILEKESERRILVIDNYDRNTVLNLLAYIYGGIAYTEHKSYEWIFYLYKAANEYQIAQLKQKCIIFIEENLNRDNVSRVLEFAIECDLDSLQKNAQKFMLNMQKLQTAIDSDDFKFTEKCSD